MSAALVPGFSLLLLADVLFNHSEHAKLVETVCKTLRREVDARALVFFTPHRPWLLERDMAFFDLAKDAGLRVEKVEERVLEGPMFKEDPGNEDLRRRVFGYEMMWAKG